MAVGCGTHTAQIHDRDGALVARAELLLEVDWSRALDEVSTARVLVRPEGDCCEALARVRSWRHELHIHLDGRPVWSGPVTQVGWLADDIEIQAADVLAWLDVRVPHQDMQFGNSDLAQIAETLIEDAFAPDDPGHAVVIVARSRVSGAREYWRDEGQTGDHLRDLAQTGLDYTAIGERILLLPEDWTEKVGSLTDEDFPDGLAITEEGSTLATRWVVHGKDDDNEDPHEITGTAGGIDPYYGLIERVIVEDSILDQGSAIAAARSRLRASTPAPTYIDTSQQTTLSPDAAVDVPQLVPGWCLDITTTQTCRRLTQTFKIVGVRVTERGSGESVSVQLAPTGAGGAGTV